eukprot:4128352-Prymnesium_polylepis.1
MNATLAAHYIECAPAPPCSRPELFCPVCKRSRPTEPNASRSERAPACARPDRAFARCAAAQL